MNHKSGTEPSWISLKFSPKSCKLACIYPHLRFFLCSSEMAICSVNGCSDPPARYFLPIPYCASNAFCQKYIPCAQGPCLAHVLNLAMFACLHAKSLHSCPTFAALWNFATLLIEPSMSSALTARFFTSLSHLGSLKISLH